MTVCFYSCISIMVRMAQKQMIAIKKKLVMKTLKLVKKPLKYGWTFRRRVYKD